ncbi:MAG: hypothetical protein AB7T38_10595 [Nitrospirales bacterium]
MPEVIGELNNTNILTGLIMSGSLLWMILFFRMLSNAQMLHVPSFKNDRWVKRRYNNNLQ